MSTPAVELLEPFGDAELIPLPDLSNRLEAAFGVDLDKSARAKWHAAGLFDYAEPPAPGRPALITREQAIQFVWACLLAAALGVAVAAILRGARNLEVQPSELVPPSVLQKVA